MDLFFLSDQKQFHQGGQESVLVLTHTGWPLRRTGLDSLLTQVVLETVAGLVGVWEAGIKGRRPVTLDLLLHLLRHFHCTCKSTVFNFSASRVKQRRSFTNNFSDQFDLQLNSILFGASQHKKEPGNCSTECFNNNPQSADRRSPSDRSRWMCTNKPRTL